MGDSQYSREYYRRNRQRLLAYAKRYYQNNKVARRAYHKDYYTKNWEQETARMKRAQQKKSELRNRIALHYGCRNPNCRWQGPFDPCQLDFHHFDPKQKKGLLGEMRTASMKKFIAEINKCVVLCRCCHSYYHKVRFPLSASLKCNVDPITRQPRN